MSTEAGLLGLRKRRSLDKGDTTLKTPNTENVHNKVEEKEKQGAGSPQCLADPKTYGAIRVAKKIERG